MSEPEGPGAEDEGFLKRWSARKRDAVAVDDVALEESTEEPTEASPATVDVAADEDLPLLTDEDMPPVASLTSQSDLSDFFNRGVSADLRRLALRHVFSLPVYNERDGLNDYDEDFTSFEPLGDVVTSDMKWHKARKEREAEEAAEQEARELAEADDDALLIDEEEEPEEVLEAEDATEEAIAQDDVEIDEVDESLASSSITEPEVSV